MICTNCKYYATCGDDTRERECKGKEMDLTNFVLIGTSWKEAYEDFCDFEEGFDTDCRTELSFEEFCSELSKGYGNSEYTQIARLYEDENGVIWYDNDYC